MGEVIGERAGRVEVDREGERIVLEYYAVPQSALPTQRMILLPSEMNALTEWWEKQQK